MYVVPDSQNVKVFSKSLFDAEIKCYKNQFNNTVIGEHHIPMDKKSKLNGQKCHDLCEKMVTATYVKPRRINGKSTCRTCSPHSLIWIGCTVLRYLLDFMRLYGLFFRFYIGSLHLLEEIQVTKIIYIHNVKLMLLRMIRLGKLFKA